VKQSIPNPVFSKVALLEKRNSSPNSVFSKVVLLNKWNSLNLPSHID